MRARSSAAICLLMLSACSRHEGDAREGRPPLVKATSTEANLKGVVRTRFDYPNPTPEQLSRRAKSIKAIRDMDLPVLEELPVIEDTHSVQLRSPEEIAKRCVATTFCAVRGESNDQKLVDKLIKDYSASEYLSPKECRFLAQSKPSQQDLIDFAWRYECVHVFLWAMGERDSIAPANAICPVGDDMKLIQKRGPEKFVADAKRRPANEILDMADYYYRLHWAAVELRIRNTPTNLVNEEVIRERVRALNWIIRALNQEWDDVSTDT